jgi:hypothetical protein
VGINAIADWAGNFPQLRFGTQVAPLVSGKSTPAQASGNVGLLFPSNSLLNPVDSMLGSGQPGSAVHHQFIVNASVGAVTWSNLIVDGPGLPAIAPILTDDGTFTWDSRNSAAGTWTFQATATDLVGSAIARLTISLVPEPATMTHFSLAIVGLLGLARRR